MARLVKPQKLDLDVIATKLRMEIVLLNHMLSKVEEKQDTIIDGFVESVETELNRIRKYINVN